MGIFDKKKSKNFELFKKQYNKVLGGSIKLVGDNFDISMLNGEEDETVSAITGIFTDCVKMSASVMDVYEEVIDDLKSTRSVVENSSEDIDNLRKEVEFDIDGIRKRIDNLDSKVDKILEILQASEKKSR